ncbi:DNA gyrase subunit A [Aggregatilineales bacterium SYSU G02658]
MENDELEGSNLGIIRPVNINEEMRGSFLDYAMSVIVARALPDARDGLKPVHRRVLYAMYDMGIRPNTAYKKSARIVGEVLGKYHPHGDASVYDAMARMVQDFSLRYPLVDGQGNFGSLDGDSPAAMRYTEARLAQIAGELLADINMNTVDFVENYDGSQMEPTVLPARMPNLLLNGATGIAVGMATNIPPHNMRELAGAINYIIDNIDRVDDISVDELMQFVKGPDFPTGAKILVGDELREAYATGKGRVIVRATVHEEEHRNGHRLIVTSIPYQVSKQSVIERIVQLVKEGKIDTIRDLRDESDRSGMRLVVEIKPTASFRTVRNQLYKYTQLQTFYSIQMLALVGGEPRNLSLKRALQIFIEHRYDVIVRRSEFELEKQRARAHILMGLLKAVSAIDDVIRIIRNADDVDDARQKLMAFLDLSEAQANAILDMQLRRLAALERQKLQDEYNEVQARIEYLEDLLASPKKILQVVRDDVNEIAEKYGDERKTVIDEESAHLNEEDLYEREEMVITLTSKGYIKRVPSRYYRAQRRGGKGVRGMETKDDDTLLEIVGVNNLDTILFFSDKGKVYSERAFRIPEGQRHTRGVLTQTIINTTMDERITAILPVRSFENRDAVFVMATRQGRIKRVALEEFEAVRPSGLIAITLQEGDELGWVRMSSGRQHIVMVTEGGQSIVFNEEEVRVMGRTAGGVNAMRLIDGDVIAGMDVIDPQQHTHIFVVTQNGYGKRTQIEDYTVQSRYGMGIRTLARNDKTGPIVAMRCISERDGILLITRSGIVLRTDLSEVRETRRSTMGVTIMDLSDGDEVVGIALLSNGSGEGEEGELNGEG